MTNYPKQLGDVLKTSLTVGVFFFFLSLPVQAQVFFDEPTFGAEDEFDDVDIEDLDIDLDVEMMDEGDMEAVEELLETEELGYEHNTFAQEFYASPTQKIARSVVEVQGMSLVRTPSRKMDAQYSVITDYSPGILKTQFLNGLKNLDQIAEYFAENLEFTDFQGVEIKRLRLPSGTTKVWVGDKSFDSVNDAQNEINQVKQLVQGTGGDFDQMVIEAQTTIMVEVAAPPATSYYYGDANFNREERLALKLADHLDLGEKMWGPFHGNESGEPVLWQSFGETTWRRTNLESNKFQSQVGFWTNRLVFKGIRFPLNTINPYVEETLAIEAIGTDFKSRVDLSVGAEWRPFARNHWLSNFRPFGDIPILEFAKNYRFIVQYGDRKNLKDEIAAKDHNLTWGLGIFYEFGVELPPLDKPAPQTFWEYVEDTVWGEYFGQYYVETTNFSSIDDFDALTANSSVILGLKLPGIPLPDNPINNRLELWPYLRFTHVNNSKFSFSFQNYYALAAGVRWMPFRTLKWKENEWLSKIKVFAEWWAIGRVQHNKVDGEVPGAVRQDLRFGVSFASRRF